MGWRHGATGWVGHAADGWVGVGPVGRASGCRVVMCVHRARVASALLRDNSLTHNLMCSSPPTTTPPTTTPPPGTMSRAEIEAGYKIGRRIEAEERALDAALLVFTSTQQEVKDQWGLYDG